ncbi:MAG: hypothetical protein OXI73_15990 [Rhodospirillales bacterium]|nr:hypothetical protein [Rhodospirillales bacterium]
MFNNHLMKVCLAAVFAIGLAACSSSSDQAAPAPTEPPPPTQAEQDLEELRNQIAALRQQLGIDDTADIGDTVAELQATLKELQDAAAEEQRKAAEAAAAAMAATAAKLYAGIAAPTGDASSPADGDRAAAYNADDTAILVSADADLTATGHSDAVTLSENKDAMVADNHGWAGKMYADPAGGDMVEAYVYSNVEAPMMGKKFGGAAAGDEFEYTLVEGALNVANGLTDANADKVVLSGVTRTAGTETFKLPESNPGGLTNILVSGSFHGVSGTYSCTPTTPADGCTASVAAMGFTLAGGTWTFTPTNANARVRDSADTAYASYGWWLSKAANDGPFIASAFVDEKGTVDAASGLNNLNGTATYVGGAAGKYALSSTTGGTNDAGHFTARATLEANFTTNTAETAISGTIDNFMGADGMSRDWSVKLNGSQIGDTGEIGNASASTGVDTVWTIGGADADESGQWTGTLRNNGDDGVPQVATGTFYTEFGRQGKMVGAFGVNKQ